MNNTEYKPNSHKYKEEQKTAAEEPKRVEKVVHGAVRTKKRSDIRRVADVFISEDVKNVKSYVLMDVLVPAIKKAISDIVTNGIDMILYGETGHRGRGSSSKVSYRSYYDRRDDERRDNGRTRSRFDFDDIIFESRGEAQAVREQMEDMIKRYGVVTVADMYDMAALDHPYTSNKYGWMNISNAYVDRCGGGYIIKLPKATPID